MDIYLFVVDGLRCKVGDKKTKEGSEVHLFGDLEIETFVFIASSLDKKTKGGSEFLEVTILWLGSMYLPDRPPRYLSLTHRI